MLGVDVLLESVALFRHDHLRLLGTDDAPPHAEPVLLPFESGTVVDFDRVRFALSRNHALCEYIIAVESLNRIHLLKIESWPKVFRFGVCGLNI